jgi:hypothetical protein
MAAIVAGDILWRYSVAAAAGNTTSSAASTSLGDQISTTAWAGGSLNDLFDDISGSENAASTVDYRGVFIYNSNGANSYENPTVYLSAETAGGASIAIAIDNNDHRIRDDDPLGCRRLLEPDDGRHRPGADHAADRPGSRRVGPAHRCEHRGAELGRRDTGGNRGHRLAVAEPAGRVAPTILPAPSER